MMTNYIVPFMAYNAIFYSITSLSTSITSTQNIFKFIVEHKDSDYVIWQHQLESTDLHNKLQITSSLIKDIIRNHCHKNNVSQNEVESIINELTNPKYKMEDEDNEEEKNLSDKDNTEFTMIELVRKTSIEITVPEPVKISLLSTLETINKINNILEKIHLKINQHQKSYFKSIVKINIYDEINKIISLTKIFNERLNMLFNLLKIYKDLIIK
jgi:hypothetical protein